MSRIDRAAGALVLASACGACSLAPPLAIPDVPAPAAYKDFNEVLRSVELAGLATEVARLKARFVIKDSDESLGGAA